MSKKPTNTPAAAPVQTGKPGAQPAVQNGGKGGAAQPVTGGGKPGPRK